MQIAKWLFLIWLVAIVVAGVVGDLYLTRLDQTRTEAAFLQDVRAALAVLRASPWKLPLESNSRWQSAEQLLRLDIVPSRWEPASSATATQTTPNLPALDSSTTSPLQRIRTSTGVQRLSTTIVALLELNGTDKIEQAAYALRITRELPPTQIRRTWWTLWTTCNLCGVLSAMTILGLQYRQSRLEQSILLPWLNSTLESTRRLDADLEYLPPINELDSRLEPSLSLIAERVNHVVAHLHSDNARSDLVLGNLQEGVLAVDDDSQILLANNALRQLLQLSDEQYLYRPLLEIVRNPTVAQLIDHVLREQVARQATIDLSKSAKSLLLLARPLPLSDGRQGALLTVRDQTLIKRIESVRRDFVTNASHELKTPLAAIRAYAETLQMGALDDPAAAQQFVGKIIEQADRIHTLIQGMLQLSRVQAGSALRIEALDPSEALETCMAAAEAMGRAKDIQVTFDLVHSQVLYTDRDGFQTIASNLLSNAVRYTPQGGSVSLRTFIDEGWFVLEVSDTGIGIRDDDIERIFERFYRAEKDRSTDTGGTGLGLSIVKHLVQALGGTVSAESRPHSGSRFQVRLPLKSI
ncbi:MAG: ATP-binding protein [Pirellulaceae bacterium]